MLGGASGAGAIANAFLQLTALVLIAWFTAIAGVPDTQPGPQPAVQIAAPAPAVRIAAVGPALRIVAAGAALMLLQLVPLPYATWAALPGHAPFAQAFALAAIHPAWLPISLTPDATIAALLSLLPAAAMIVTASGSTGAGRREAVVVLLVFALWSVALGCLQRSAGEESGLYPYAVTNRGSAVGLFANRNHLGSLLVCTLPFVAALARASPDRTPPPRLLAATGAAILVSGAALTGSMAATLLLIPSLAVSAAILFRDRKASRPALLILPVLILSVLILAAPAILLLGRADAGGEDSARSQHRAVIAATTMRAAIEHSPLGSGGGSFRALYPAYENPAGVTPEYVSHAHDDYLEILLEYGIPGAVLIVVALAAWGRWTWRAWREPGDDGDLARAAAAALGLILLHSMVDYPVRTAAMAAVAGLAVALLSMPPSPRSIVTDRLGADMRGIA